MCRRHDDDDVADDNNGDDDFHADDDDDDYDDDDITNAVAMIQWQCRSSSLPHKSAAHCEHAASTPRE